MDSIAIMAMARAVTAANQAALRPRGQARSYVMASWALVGGEEVTTAIADLQS